FPKHDIGKMAVLCGSRTLPAIVDDGSFRDEIDAPSPLAGLEAQVYIFRIHEEARTEHPDRFKCLFANHQTRSRNRVNRSRLPVVPPERRASPKGPSREPLSQEIGIHDFTQDGRKGTYAGGLNGLIAV